MKLAIELLEEVSTRMKTRPGMFEYACLKNLGDEISAALLNRGFVCEELPNEFSSVQRKRDTISIGSLEKDIKTLGGPSKYITYTVETIRNESNKLAMCYGLRG